MAHIHLDHRSKHTAHLHVATAFLITVKTENTVKNGNNFIDYNY